MRTIGSILIAVVVILYLLWLRFQRKQEAAVLGASGRQELTVIVKGAYSPNVINVKRGVPVRLHFDRREDTDCSRFVVFSDLQLRKDLPAFSITDIEFTPEKTGEIPFTCDMGMYQGMVKVVE